MQVLKRKKGINVLTRTNLILIIICYLSLFLSRTALQIVKLGC